MPFSDCFLLLHGFGVALKSFLFLPHDNACTTRLAAVSSRTSLPVLTDIISDLSFFTSIFLCVLFSFKSIFLTCLLLFLFSLFLLVFACLGLREKGGLGAVCLKPSRINLLRPSAVRKDCIFQFSFFFPFSFFNPGHFCREKWLPSLFFFSSLNQGNNRKILEIVAVTFFFYKDWLWQIALPRGL